MDNPLPKLYAAASDELSESWERFGGDQSAQATVDAG
jgi:hypothetical protein